MTLNYEDKIDRLCSNPSGRSNLTQSIIRKLKMSVTNWLAILDDRGNLVVLVEPRSIQEIWDEISKIVVAFPLLECDRCVIAALNWLNQNNIPSQVLRLKTKRRNDLYIVSNRVASGESITENGTHYGIEIFGKVFDNLSEEGLSREDWLKDFRCRSGQFILEELDSL